MTLRPIALRRPALLDPRASAPFEHAAPAGLLALPHLPEERHVLWKTGRGWFRWRSQQPRRVGRRPLRPWLRLLFDEGGLCRRTVVGIGNRRRLGNIVSDEDRGRWNWGRSTRGGSRWGRRGLGGAGGRGEPGQTCDRRQALRRPRAGDHLIEIRRVRAASSADDTRGQMIDAPCQHQRVAQQGTEPRSTIDPAARPRRWVDATARRRAARGA
jgi:hypothetical protein